MTSLSEQLSAARKSQLEAQIEFMRALTAQAFESAERVLALNINTSRATVERSSNAVKQLLAITDPRDLLAFGTQTQEEVQNMMAYGRELFSIAASARLNISRQAGATSAALAATAAPAAAAAPGPQPHAVKPSKKPVVATEEPAVPEALAKAKPIAKAAGKVAQKPPAEHPLASPVAPAQDRIEIPPIKPLEAAPPPAPVSGTPLAEAKQHEQPTAKQGRRK